MALALQLPAKVERAREFARQLWGSFGRNLPLDLAAQLAYFAVLSVFPFAMFLLTVLGYIPLHGLDERAIRSLYLVLPVQVAQWLETILREIVGHHRGWLMLSTLLFCVWSASDVVHGLVTALNRAYDVAETRPAWRIRVRAVLVTVGGGVAILVAAVGLLIGPGLLHGVWDLFGIGSAFEHAWRFLRWPAVLLTMMTLLACVYHFLPNVDKAWHFLTPGSIVAVIAWLALSLGFRLYVSHFSSYAKTYGVLGTGILFLMWLYWSSAMVILGGEINATVDRVYKGIVHREKHAGPPTVHDPLPGRGRRQRPPPRTFQPA
jgi:membrane protein